MTPIEVVFEELITINIWFIVKLVVLFALSVYLVFVVMVIREVDLMNRTITGGFNLPIKIIAIVHLLLSILVFVLAVVIL